VISGGSSRRFAIGNGEFLDYTDYKVTFTDDEKSRLQAVFPEGVCDWSKPGVHQSINQTWLSYGPSPVNRYAP
jgi:Tannase-like family of unknown function (DUF6351)